MPTPMDLTSIEVPQEEPGEWLPVDVSTLNEGDRVRVTPRNHGEVIVGTVISRAANNALVAHPGRFRGEYFLQNYRTFEKWVPTSVGYTWVDVDALDLQPGDYARGLHPTGAADAVEGVVERVTTMGFVKLDSTAGRLSPQRTWQKRVPAEALDAVPLAESTPEPTTPFTWQPIEADAIEPGMYVRGTPRPGYRWSAEPIEGEVRSLVERTDLTIVGDYERNGLRDKAARLWEQRVEDATPTPAQAEGTWVDRAPSELRHGDRVRSKHSGDRDWDEGVFERIPEVDMHVRLVGDGYLYSPAREWQRFEVPEAPAPAASDGWVPIATTTLQVGDTVRATPNAIGGRMQAEVAEVTGLTYRARTVHVIETSSNGRRIDVHGSSNGTYMYTFTESDTLVWRGDGAPPVPTPAPSLRFDLPEWATRAGTLEAVRQEVHNKARTLYRNGDNCWSGTRDFLSEAGLPSDPDQAYPTPDPVDETEQIKEFLIKVREAALSTALDHGKSLAQVRGWLNDMGIREPRPTTRDVTVTVRVPHDANVDQVMRDLGWEMI